MGGPISVSCASLTLDLPSLDYRVLDLVWP